MGKAARAMGGITEGLVRFSVGIENVNDIINDLEQALQEVGKANLPIMK
jgi:cystathionine beta-lyase